MLPESETSTVFFTWYIVEEAKPCKVTWLEYSFHSVVVQVVFKTDPALGIRGQPHSWDSAKTPAVPVTLLLSQARDMNCHKMHCQGHFFLLLLCFKESDPVKFRYEWQQPRYRVVKENSRGLGTELVSTDTVFCLLSTQSLTGVWKARKCVIVLVKMFSYLH